MLVNRLVLGAFLAVALAGAAAADDYRRAFVARSISPGPLPSASGFPLAPEARSRSVNDLIALLERVQSSDSSGTVGRVVTLEQAIQAVAWRRHVADRLELLFR